MSSDPELKLRQFCECCGRPFPVAQSPEWLLTHFREGMHFALLERLIINRQNRRMTSARELIEVMEATARKKPVLNPQAYLTMRIDYLRSRLFQFGWDIAGHTQTGTGYLLVRIDWEWPVYNPR